MLNIEYNVDLSALNTLALPATAESLLTITDLHTLRAAIAFANAQNLAITVLGGGSNVILAADIPGLVLHIKISGMELLSVSTDAVVVKVGAGESWPRFVEQSLANDWFGLENLSLIPGTVGAAPVQNIGAYGVELCDSFIELQAVDVTTGELMQLSKQDCQFGYRDSVFKGRLKNRVAISSVTFKLSTIANLQLSYPALQKELQALTAAEVTPQLVSDVICRVRRSKLPDPALIPNAGSFFKNPVVSGKQARDLLIRFPSLVTFPATAGKVKLAAGWMIEQTGWKGVSRGPVAVHSEQALVLVNKQGGSGQQLLALAAAVAASVFDMFGVSLEIEPRVLPNPPLPSGSTTQL